MGLVERLSTEPRVYLPKCAVGRLLESLTDVDRSAVEGAIGKIRSAHPNERKARHHVYTAKWLCAELKAEGYEIHRATMNRHVNKECSCGS